MIESEIKKLTAAIQTLTDVLSKSALPQAEEVAAQVVEVAAQVVEVKEEKPKPKRKRKTKAQKETEAQVEKDKAAALAEQEPQEKTQEEADAELTAQWVDYSRKLTSLHSSTCGDPNVVMTKMQEHGITSIRSATKEQLHALCSDPVFLKTSAVLQGQS